MNVRAFGCAASLVALVACGSPDSSGAPATVAEAARALAQHGGSASWRSRNANADLLYVSDLGTNAVDVYSYPALQSQGTLTGFKAPHGICVDKAGDVFITNTGMSQILEYAHGGTTPIATLDDAGFSPVACAIDPKSGDVAVANLTVSRGSGEGNLAIYPAGGGAATTYTAPNVYFYYACTYDAKGDLFVDGSTQHVNAFGLAEMPRGAGAFSPVTLDQSIETPGGLAWKRNHLVVDDQGIASDGSTIFEFTVANGYGTEVGVTPLYDSIDVAEFAFEGGSVIGPDASGIVYIWRYPPGGSPRKALGGFGNPHGVAISKAR